MRRSLLSIALFAPLLATAQDDEPKELPRWYQVEMVVFQQNRVNTEELFQRSPFEDENSSIWSNATNINSLLNKLPNGDNIALPEPELLSGNQLVDEIITSPSVTPLEETTELVEPGTPTFIAATQDELFLSRYQNILRRRSAYRVLWHGAWQQELEENSQINEYQLTAGTLLLVPDPKLEQEAAPIEPSATPTEPQNLDKLFDSLSAETPIPDIAIEQPIDVTQTKQEKLAEAEAIVASAPKAFRELQGSFKIYKKRFAHLEFDLWFATTNATEPGLTVPLITYMEEPLVTDGLKEEILETNIAAENPAAEIPLESPPVEFELSYELAYTADKISRIQEDRRIRPGVLYYVDNPLFGIILKMEEVLHPSLRDEAADANKDPLAF